MTRRVLRRPRTTPEIRAASAAEADREDGVPGLRPRPRPTAWDDQLISALTDRSRDLPPHLRRRGDSR
jgi:hypothetical protein